MRRPLASRHFQGILPLVVGGESRGRLLVLPCRAEWQSTLLLFVVFFLLVFPQRVLASSTQTIIAKVVRISDGDTLVATAGNGTKLRIRLLGIDAPEVAHGEKPGQPFGVEARDYLDHLIGGKTVRVDAYGPDEYKRILAVVWDEQINVNLLMVAMGYAEVYRGVACQVHCRELAEAEAKARQDRVGMWVQGATYESAAAFRKRMQIRGN